MARNQCSSAKSNQKSSAHLTKRVFDLTVCLITVPVWVPLMVSCGLLIWVFEGRPIFYVSTRRVFQKKSIRLLKFRTMVRNADKVANRDTVPVEGVRFLNLPPNSPLYTRVGRLIERFHLTELPQVLHILRGDMTFIGNRPLPENVIACLRADFPYAEDRFLAPCGLTGPVQLVGRAKLSDEERLGLEVRYCRVVANSYSVILDLIILSRTVLSVLGVQKFFESAEETVRLMARHSDAVPAQTVESGVGVRPAAIVFREIRPSVSLQTSPEPRAVVGFEQSGNLVAPLKTLLHPTSPDRSHAGT